MLREDVAAELREQHGRDGLIYPAYDSYCFGNVPDTVRRVLDVGGRRPLPDDVFEGVRTDVERVVVILVDGYGLNVWRRDRDRLPFLGRLTDRATVTPLTSIYPSETAAAITTFETGALPCEHGRIGWNVYEPETDRTFTAFTGEVKSGDDGAEVAPEAFEGFDFHYAALEEMGVDCHRLRPFEESAAGVTDHTYEELDEFGGRLASTVEACDAPGYVYAYLPEVDAVGHDTGADSDAFRSTVAAVFDEISAFVDRLDETTARETLLVVTADHGQIDADPDRNVDLSRRPELLGALRRHRDGSPVRMSGSLRNTHLHLREDGMARAREAVADLDAATFTRSAMLERNLMGDREPTDRFRRRCGDLVLSHRTLGTWFGDVEPEELGLVGLHGGLHPDEMLVPFAAVRADRLR